MVGVGCIRQQRHSFSKVSRRLQRQTSKILNYQYTHGFRHPPADWPRTTVVLVKALRENNISEARLVYFKDPETHPVLPSELHRLTNVI